MYLSQNAYIQGRPGRSEAISNLIASKENSHQTKPHSTNPTMKCDSLARRAFLFVAFIITATILYAFTTRFLFTAPNYDDVSIDPEGGSYYDYGSRVAAAVWKGAGSWIGMTESISTNDTATSDAASDDASDKLQDPQALQLDSTESHALHPGRIATDIARQESVSGRPILRSRRMHLRPEHR